MSADAEGKGQESDNEAKERSSHCVRGVGAEAESYGQGRCEGVRADARV